MQYGKRNKYYRKCYLMRWTMVSFSCTYNAYNFFWSASCNRVLFLPRAFFIHRENNGLPPRNVPRVWSLISPHASPHASHVSCQVGGASTGLPWKKYCNCSSTRMYLHPSPLVRAADSDQTVPFFFTSNKFLTLAHTQQSHRDLCHAFRKCYGLQHFSETASFVHLFPWNLHSFQFNPI